MNLKITEPNIESMKERLADNDAVNYSNGYDIETLYKMIKEGIKGYDNMKEDEIINLHDHTFGWVDYKLS